MAKPRLANPTVKKNKDGGQTLHDFKSYYKATVIKTVWYWWKNQQRAQFNKIESLPPKLNSPKIDPPKYSQWFLTKLQRQNDWEKIFSSNNGAGTIEHSHINKSV